MQDEVNTKVIALVIKGGRISAEVLEKALKKFVEEIEKAQKQASRPKTYLRSSFFRSVFDDSNSTAINQLTQDMLKRAIAPLPPLSEQRRIVETIDAMLFELNQIEKSLS